MNYLAHALLAGPADADRVGGLLGDFVKGPLPGVLPPDLAAGVGLHRRIDSYAETHPAFNRSRSRVSDARRRYAGIMVDLFYDHFLAVHWSRFSDQTLPDFAAETYALLDEHQQILPPRLAGILPVMREDDWLSSYRDPAIIALALNRMSAHRLSQPNPLAGGGEELLRDMAGFEEDFLAFFPDALDFCREVRAAR